MSTLSASTVAPPERVTMNARLHAPGVFETALTPLAVTMRTPALRAAEHQAVDYGGGVVRHRKHPSVAPRS